MREGEREREKNAFVNGDGAGHRQMGREHGLFRSHALIGGQLNPTFLLKSLNQYSQS